MPSRAVYVSLAVAPRVMAPGFIDVAALVDSDGVYGRVVVARCGGCALVAMAPLRCRAGVVCCFKFLVGTLFIIWFMLSMVLVL